jgi:hypothetical protein
VSSEEEVEGVTSDTSCTPRERRRERSKGRKRSQKSKTRSRSDNNRVRDDQNPLVDQT